MVGLDRYGTQNLYEAAYLLAQGMRLVGKERKGNKMVVYLEGQDAQAKAMEFYGKTRIDAKTLFDCYRTLKDFVFQA